MGRQRGVGAWRWQRLHLRRSCLWLRENSSHASASPPRRRDIVQITRRVSRSPATRRPARRCVRTLLRARTRPRRHGAGAPRRGGDPSAALQPRRRRHGRRPAAARARAPSRGEPTPKTARRPRRGGGLGAELGGGGTGAGDGFGGGGGGGGFGDGFGDGFGGGGGGGGGGRRAAAARALRRPPPPSTPAPWHLPQPPWRPLGLLKLSLTLGATPSLFRVLAGVVHIQPAHPAAMNGAIRRPSPKACGTGGRTPGALLRRHTSSLEEAGVRPGRAAGTCRCCTAANISCGRAELQPAELGRYTGMRGRGARGARGARGVYDAAYVKIEDAFLRHCVWELATTFPPREAGRALY